MAYAQTLAGYTHKGLVAVALLLSVVALGMWGRHLLIINDAMSMARALTWTVVALGAHGVAATVERYGLEQ